MSGFQMLVRVLDEEGTPYPANKDAQAGYPAADGWMYCLDFQFEVVREADPKQGRAGGDVSICCMLKIPGGTGSTTMHQDMMKSGSKRFSFEVIEFCAKAESGAPRRHQLWKLKRCQLGYLDTGDAVNQMARSVMQGCDLAGGFELDSEPWTLMPWPEAVEVWCPGEEYDGMNSGIMVTKFDVRKVRRQ